MTTDRLSPDDIERLDALADHVAGTKGRVTRAGGDQGGAEARH